MSRVSESCNSLYSFVKPSLQVGKQIGGGFGWRAWIGNDGTCAGGTATGMCCGECSEVCGSDPELTG